MFWAQHEDSSYNNTISYNCQLFYFGGFYENSKSLLKSTSIYIYRWKSGYNFYFADYISEQRRDGNICERCIPGLQSQVGVLLPNKFLNVYIFTETFKNIYFLEGFEHQLSGCVSEIQFCTTFTFSRNRCCNLSSQNSKSQSLWIWGGI